ncbi:MAG: FCD domain-containing protein [Kiritimatiellales bacterium]
MKAADQVLNWIETYIEENHLGEGDSLPSEHTIMAESGAGRSSVRETLSALKILGIIQSRQKSGIRIIRNPITLGFRHYFSDQYDDPEQYDDMVEFRMAMEWGLGTLIFKHINAPTIKALQSLVQEVEMLSNATLEDITLAEIEFHRILITGCGNRLAGLFVHVYEPIFRNWWTVKNFEQVDDYGKAWVQQHKGIVDALIQKNEKLFLKLLKKHTRPYL